MYSRPRLGSRTTSDNMQSVRGAGGGCLQTLQVVAKHVSRQCEQLHRACSTAARRRRKGHIQQAEDPVHTQQTQHRSQPQLTSLQSAFEQQQLQQQPAVPFHPSLPQHMSAHPTPLLERLERQQQTQQQKHVLGLIRQQLQQLQAAVTSSDATESPAPSADSFSRGKQQKPQQPVIPARAVTPVSALHPVLLLEGTTSNGSSGSNTSSSSLNRGPPPNRPRPRRSYGPWPSNEGAPAPRTISSPLQPKIPPVQQPTPPNPSSSTTNGTNSSSSSSNSSSYRPSYMQMQMSQPLLDKIRAGGLTALPGWEHWGDQQLLQDWNTAVEQLPAAVDRLAAVCRSGPIKLVTFDLETAAFGSAIDIVEVAACLPDFQSQQFQSLVRPLGLIDEGSQEATGIGWKMVQDQPPLPQVLLQWVSWLAEQCSNSPGATSTLVFMGHNIKGFDLKVLRVWATALNLPKLAELLDTNGANGLPIVDVLVMLKRNKQELESKGIILPKLKLQNVRSVLGIPANQAHRALDDSIVAMQVFSKLAPLLLDSSSSSSSPADLAQALLDKWQQQSAIAAASLQQKKQAYAEKKEKQQLLQQQQQQQQPAEEPDLQDLISSAASSSSSGLMYVPGSAAANLPDPPDPDHIESKVSQALAMISDHDLRFDHSDLRSAWLPLTQEVGLKMKGFTDKQAEKLVSAEFENLLKVLLYVPKIRIYAPAIHIGSSSSNSSQQVPAADAAAAASSSEDLDEEDPEQQLVDLRGRILAVFSPIPWVRKTGASWQMLIEAPTDSPEVGPVVLSARFMEFGFTSYMALAACKQQHAAAVQAQKQGKLASLRTRVKQVSPWQSKVVDAAVEWETDGKVVIDYVTEDAAADSSSSSSSRRQTLSPVYKSIRDLKADDWLNKGKGKGIAAKALDVVRDAAGNFDVLPKPLSQRYQLPSFTEALDQIHQPQDLDTLGAARTTLALQELTLVQIAQLLERYWLQRGLQQQPVAAALSAATVTANGSSSSEESQAAVEPVKKAERPAQKVDAAAAAASTSSSDSLSSSDDLNRSPRQQLLPARPSQQQQQQHGAAAAYQISNMKLVNAAKKLLPYTLTADQEVALSEVLDDLSRPQAMLRLLQGDVGCGKTVVAALGCLAAAGSGCQALMLAPTELLATQHLSTLQKIAEELPLVQRPRIGLLSRTVTTKPKEKTAMHAAIADDKLDILVSTQAALFVPKWGKLGLVVVDEQHKFGVKQREKLLQNLPAPPHMLLMTATPIPRTLALVTYGGLVLSTITQMPPGRSKVATKVIVDSERARRQVYATIHNELVSGGRVYIVCPLVSENEDLEGVRAATEEYETLQSSGLFGDFKCGLLHGKMKGEEKAAVLKDFNTGETPVLIASTVVEVGIDEPEASIMLVENADRFGLAQLHQLRGRVGRGSRASRCFLMAPPQDWEGSDRSTERLRVLENSHNGLHIAEADLKIRGPGDVWGTKQSGKTSAFSTMTWQELEAAPQLLEHARAAAAELLPQLGIRPEVKAALLAYGLMSLKEGQQLPILRDGVSGV